MTGAGRKRGSRTMAVRRMFEVILLGASLVAGLGVIASCVTTVPTSGGANLSVGNLVSGIVFSLILVGAVFLFTTMSRDLRLLREKYTADDEASPGGRPPDEGQRPVQTDADV